MSRDLAEYIVNFLNELLKDDRPAIAALIANRVPCNEKLANHPLVQCAAQHGGYHVGMLGILNGLCGVDENVRGPIEAVFEGDKEDDAFLDLKCFRVNDTWEEKK